MDLSCNGSVSLCARFSDGFNRMGGGRDEGGGVLEKSEVKKTASTSVCLCVFSSCSVYQIIK